MGIFSRFRDIVNSNINAMLDKAEDPEKLIKLMIQEMEDTLVELKASCAGAMANRKRVERDLEAAEQRVGDWEKRARMAVDKGREDLAREALVEKRNSQEEVDAREGELRHFEEVIDQYKNDIQQLEEKLANARNKHRLLVQRHIQANKRKVAQSNIRRADNLDTITRFEHFEQRIDRMEADADLINYGRKPSASEEFDRLETDEEIEEELRNLKSKAKDKKPEA